MEPQTEDLAKNAIQSGAFVPLSANRLRRELALLLDAPEVVPSLQELERLGCLEFLGVEDPLEKRDWEIVGRLGHLRESATDVARAEAGLRWWLVYLMATTLGASRRARTRLARRLDLDERLGAILMGGPERVERVTTVLETPRVRPSMMKRALDGLTGEELALLRATIDSGGRERVEEWDRSLRDLRLGISGSDLVTAGYTPGPEIGEVLEATLDARVDGRIRPDEEMEFALAQLAGENSGIGTES
jgi:tRNA nucleotidyltransferase/poly(A) polymerase